jgi:tight adherence protein B
LTLPGAAALSIVLPRAILRRQQSRAEAAFMNHFPAAIDMAIRMLRAGLPVTAIVRVIGREAPSPINQVFTRLADQLEIGLSFTEALNAMSERIGLADFRFFVMAVSLQSDTGGNLATTLETLSAIIRKRREIRLQARSSTAEVRVSALLLGGLPLLVTVLLLVTNPRYLLPLFADRRGNLIVLVALAMLGFGVVSMRQMMRRVTRV